MAAIATQIHAAFDRFPVIKASSHIVPYFGTLPPLCPPGRPPPIRKALVNRTAGPANCRVLQASILRPEISNPHFNNLHGLAASYPPQLPAQTLLRSLWIAIIVLHHVLLEPRLNRKLH